MIKKILNICILSFFVFWVYAIVTDFQKVKNDDKAVYCIRQTLYDYTDGSVEECLGLGYKVFYYNRTSINAKTDFGPFWMKLRK